MTRILQLCIVLENKKGCLKFGCFFFKYNLLNFFLIKANIFRRP